MGAGTKGHRGSLATAKELVTLPRAVSLEEGLQGAAGSGQQPWPGPQDLRSLAGPRPRRPWCPAVLSRDSSEAPLCPPPLQPTWAPLAEVTVGTPSAVPLLSLWSPGVRTASIVQTGRVSVRSRHVWLHGEEQLEMESLRVTGKRRLSVSRVRLPAGHRARGQGRGSCTLGGDTAVGRRVTHTCR